MKTSIKTCYSCGPEIRILTSLDCEVMVATRSVYLQRGFLQQFLNHFRSDGGLM